MSSARTTAEDLATKMRENLARHVAAQEEDDGIKELCQLPMSKIDPNPYQPRTNFDEAHIAELAESIKEGGLRQPITVRRNKFRFEIVHGESRFRAHQLLGATTIEAVVVNISDQQMAVDALVENLVRRDLNDFETARGFRNIMPFFSSKKELAESLSIARGDFYRYLDFFDLPQFIIDRLEEDSTLFGRTTAGQLKACAEKFKDQPELATVLSETIDLIVKKELDMTKAEEFILAKFSGVLPPPKKTKESPEIRELRWGNSNKPTGTITKKGGHLVVKLKTKALNEAQEQRLMAFLETLGNE